MTSHLAAEAAYWAVLSRNRIGDTATPERHREAIEDYIKTRFGGDPSDALAAQSARIAELEAEAARLRGALKEAVDGLEESALFVKSKERIKWPEGDVWFDGRLTAARAALQPQGK